MADVANSSRTVLATPFLMKRYLVTGDASGGGEITHGMSVAPAACWAQPTITDTSPDQTVIELDWLTDPTKITIDAVTASDFYIFAIWADAAAQDGSSIG
jgi:hypothetical protein